MQSRVRPRLDWPGLRERLDIADAVELVKRLRGVAFPEAARMAAELSGIPDSARPTVHSPQNVGWDEYE